MHYLEELSLIVRRYAEDRPLSAPRPIMAGTSSIAIGVTFARAGVHNWPGRCAAPGAYKFRARPPLYRARCGGRRPDACASQAVIIAGLLAGAAWKMLGFRCRKKQAPGRKLFCPARDPVAESRNERPRPDLNTPDRRRGGSVQPAGDFRRGSASSSNPSEIELTRSGSDSKARSPFWGGASP